MAQLPQSAYALASPLIAQCRADIAAAWEQVEAGRRILAHSGWLLARWAELARTPARPIAEAARPMGGDFIAVVETPRRRLQFRRRLRLRAVTPTRFAARATYLSRPPSRNPPPSASG